MTDPLEDLFTGELAPIVRRLGERALGAGPYAEPDADEHAARQAVWQVLADSDAMSPRGVVARAEILGAALYQSPWADTMTVADLLGSDLPGAEDPFAPMRADIRAGTLTFALALRVCGGDDPARPGALTVSDGTLSGVRRHVAFAADVDRLLVAGHHDGQQVLAVVDRAGPGVTVRRHDDITRGDTGAVDLDRAPIIAVLPAERWPHAVAGARLRHASWLVGLSCAALRLTVAYTRQREQFGAPIARLQSVAFRLAALAARITTARDLVAEGAIEHERGGDARLVSVQALALAAELARDVTTDAVQLHGAYGMTEECDAQLYFRRAAADAVLWGAPMLLHATAGRLLADIHRPLEDDNDRRAA